MKLGLVSSYVPFINGGARFIVEWLEEKLREHGHEVERFYLPFVDEPSTMLGQHLSFRMLRFDNCDRLICLRPPAHVIDHPDKVLWFIHHIRAFYDLWDTPHRHLPDDAETRSLRREITAIDDATLREARAVFTNSQVVADRLKRFNGVDATPLYPPIYRPERFTPGDYGEEIVMISRVEPHKRQELAILAMNHVRTGVKLRLVGSASSREHAHTIRTMIAENGLERRVIFEDAWATEDDKARALTACLATAYLPKDEDSYGYPSLEAGHSEKAVITTSDSGGVLELVQDSVNGFVAEPTPESLAEAFDILYRDRLSAKRMGQANLARMAALKIDWDHVVEALTAPYPPAGAA
jgi:glycosyltransferase involved in cell wall biosynthesis